MRYLYTLLFYIALPWIFLKLLWRSRNAPEYRQRLTERLGFCPHHLNQSIWVHAVSLGETIAAIPLIKALKAHYPQYSILVTNMTPTGSARVKAVFGDSVYNAYIPYDLPSAIERFVERTHPHAIIVMETELWPNLFSICKQKDIPVIVANARLSKKSARGYQRIAFLTQKILNDLTAVAAQSQADADRFIALGLDREKIRITGSMKFDLELPSDLIEKSAALREQLGKERLIWIAASTHPGEDEIILAAHKTVREKFPNALLILVPRHPERFDTVATLASQQGYSLTRRTENNCNPDTAVFLGDTTGEMLLFYSVSDVAFVGGSFAPIGGHNMLEPAALHKPIISGPQLFNFAEISEWLLTAKGMIKVKNAEELAKEIIHFFQDQHYRQQIGENAFNIVEKNRGALQRQLDLIKETTWL